jgi:hypothetical protein
MWRRIVMWTDVSEERRFTEELHTSTSQKIGILHSHRRQNLASYKFKVWIQIEIYTNFSKERN